MEVFQNINNVVSKFWDFFIYKIPSYLEKNILFLNHYLFMRPLYKNSGQKNQKILFPKFPNKKFLKFRKQTKFCPDSNGLINQFGVFFIFAYAMNGVSNFQQLVSCSSQHCLVDLHSTSDHKHIRKKILLSNFPRKNFL